MVPPEAQDRGDGLIDLGIVIIGRNEGERLARSLEAVRSAGCPMVYVDSRSSDGSVAVATELGIPVRVLDDGRPMNAARARNEGFAWLLEHHPGLRLVQFVDGDTALAPGWLETARSELHADSQLGVVAGHLAERQAGRSVFHLLAALEWRRTPGPVEATGGIFMARAAAFSEAGGFDGNVPAGEEADLCMRIRGRGFGVQHLAVQMGTHDMGDLGFRSWWLRNVRTGHAYAQGARSARYRRERAQRPGLGTRVADRRARSRLADPRVEPPPPPRPPPPDGARGVACPIPGLDGPGGMLVWRFHRARQVSGGDRRPPVRAGADARRRPDPRAVQVTSDGRKGAPP